MPGFELPQRTATLRFEDGELEGLEIEVLLSVPFGFVHELTDLLDQAKTDDGLQYEERALIRFAEVALRGWNLTSDGKPVAVTTEAFLGTVDYTTAIFMLTKFLGNIGRVSGPLAKRRGSGRRSAKRPTSKRPKSS